MIQVAILSSSLSCSYSCSTSDSSCDQKNILALLVANELLETHFRCLLFMCTRSSRPIRNYLSEKSLGTISGTSPSAPGLVVETMGRQADRYHPSDMTPPPPPSPPSSPPPPPPPPLTKGRQAVRYHPSDMTPARNNGQTCSNGLKPFSVQSLPPPLSFLTMRPRWCFRVLPLPCEC